MNLTNLTSLTSLRLSQCSTAQGRSLGRRRVVLEGNPWETPTLAKLTARPTLRL
jgi:hypothetical protein